MLEAKPGDDETTDEDFSADEVEVRAANGDSQKRRGRRRVNRLKVGAKEKQKHNKDDD